MRLAPGRMTGSAYGLGSTRAAARIARAIKGACRNY